MLAHSPSCVRTSPLRCAPSRLIGLLGVLIVTLLSVSTASASAATRYLSASGADSGSCSTSGAPCRTFSYAYRQSAPGDVVEVAGGSYGGQSVPVISGRTAPAVEFRPASGASVTLGNLSIGGSHVTVRDMKTGMVSLDAGNTGVTAVEGVSLVNVTGTGIWSQNSRKLVVRGGSYGPRTDHPVIQFGGNPASSDVLLDGVDVHDALVTNSTVHTECIWAGGVQGFTVRNSIFRNCTYFDIFFTTLNGPNPRDVVLENNVFSTTKQASGADAPYAINVANWVTKAENFLIRNNSFGGELLIQPTSLVNFRVVGNIAPNSSCKSGVSYGYNVFTRLGCASTDKVVSNALSQFVDRAAGDWRLIPGAGAIDAANPTEAPVTDRFGLGRVGAPDAGAHEHNGVLSGDATPLPLPLEPAPAPAPEPAPAPAPTSDVKAPTDPTGQAFTGSTETTVGMRWDPAIDDVGVAGYRLFRDGTAVATTTSTSHLFGGLECGRSYTFALEAFDAAGNVSNRAHATGDASTAPCPTADTQPPSVPQGQAFTTITKWSVGMRWDAASDNVGVVGYRVYRDGVAVGVTEDLAYTFGKLRCGRSYTFALEAFDAAGNASNLAYATGRTTTKPC